MSSRYQRKIVSGVTSPASSSSTRRPRTWPFAASGRRWSPGRGATPAALMLEATNGPAVALEVKRMRRAALPGRLAGLAEARAGAAVLVADGDAWTVVHVIDCREAPLLDEAARAQVAERL